MRFTALSRHKYNRKAGAGWEQLSGRAKRSYGFQSAIGQQPKTISRCYWRSWRKLFRTWAPHRFHILLQLGRIKDASRHITPATPAGDKRSLISTAYPPRVREAVDWPCAGKVDFKNSPCLALFPPFTHDPLTNSKSWPEFAQSPVNALSRATSSTVKVSPRRAAASART